MRSSSVSPFLWEVNPTQRPLIFILTLLLTASCASQTSAENRSLSSSEAGAHDWTYYFNIAGYLVPHDRSYGSPTFNADSEHLHFGARYNYENTETGSFWFGYNLSAGDKLALQFTPMVGGVVGETTGIAPGYKASLLLRRLELSTEGEFVFDLRNKSGSFFYSWMEFSYSPMDWWRAGLVAQRTKAYHTNLDIQRGMLIGFSRKKLDFTTYIFNAGWTDPTIVLALGFTF